MQSGAQISSRQMADALLGWWQLAGVDACVAEEPVDWFARPRPAAAQHATAHMPAPAHAPAAPAALPGDLEGFHRFLADSSDLTESAWAGPRVLPTGAVAPKLMVIADMPEESADSESGYLTDDAARLLDNMLRAMGVSREESYIAALAIRRPPAGIVPQDMVPQLAERMLHHIGLVRPQGIMLLGDATSRALISPEALAPRQYLRFINHCNVNFPVIVSFHPRLLLSQPAAKAESWRAMQALIGVWG